MISLKRVLVVATTLFMSLYAVSSNADSMPQAPLPITESLYYRAASSVSIHDGSLDALIIPYDAFMAAVADDGDNYEQAKQSYQELAFELNYRANGPHTLGIIADVAFATLAPTAPFSGSLFIVAIDPHYAPDGLASPYSIEFTRYFIAAVKLSGTTPWYAHTTWGSYTSFALNDGYSPFRGIVPSCCGTNVQPNQCGAIGSNSGPELCDGSLGCGLGPKPDFLANPILPTPSFQWNGGAEPTIDPGFPTGQNWNFPDGRPGVGTYIFESRDAYPTSYSIPPIPGYGCSTCEVILCNEEPISDPFLTPEILPLPPDNCSGSGGGSRAEVPEICKSISATPGNLPAACGGLAPFSGRDLPRPGCMGLGSTGGVAGSNSHWNGAALNASFAACDGSGVPVICSQIITDSPMCQPQAAVTRREQQVHALQCEAMDEQGCCGLGCGCRQSGDKEICTKCGIDGTCVTTFKKVWGLDFKNFYNNRCPDVNVDPDAFTACIRKEQMPEGSYHEFSGDEDIPETSVVPSTDSQTIPSPPNSITVNEPLEIDPIEDLKAPTIEDYKKVASEEESSFAINDGITFTGPFYTHQLVVAYLNERTDTDQNIQPDPAKTPNQVAHRSENGDPVILSNGALDIATTDLHFPGPSRPLEFVRRYSSRSNGRGILGSNWSHNFEVYIEPVKPETAPVWLPKYCSGWAPELTCLLLHDEDGSTSLFLWDPKLQVFAPQAGRTETIIKKRDYYEMRAPDGHRRIFNETGYLIEDRDRFGNGFSVEYRYTPLFLVYRRYCTRFGDEGREDSEEFYSNYQNYDPRACSVLGFIFGDQAMAFMHPEDGWVPEDGREITLPEEDVTRIHELHPWEDRQGTLAEYRENLTQGRLFLQKLLQSGYFPENTTGGLRMRPTRVVDNLGRSISFSYANDARANEHFGLLTRVEGPAGARMEFSYARPQNYPARLSEMFLTQATRTTNVIGGGGGISDAQWTTHAQQGKPREYVYTYQWPENVGGGIFESYPSYDLLYRDKKLSYFSTFVGCEYATQKPIFSAGYGNGCGGSSDMGTVRERTSGNPCWLAELARQTYISSVADNIIAVERSGAIEVESSYEADPDKVDFDHVVAQRYGGAQTQPTGGWASGYPNFSLSYFEAGPSLFEGSYVDLVSYALPDEISARYPLEGLTDQRPGQPDADEWSCVPEDPDDDYPDDARCATITPHDPNPSSAITCAWSTNQSVSSNYPHSCDFEVMQQKNRELPGHREVYDYFEQPYEPVSSTTQLKRSRLTCAQLATAHIADPLHNDILSVIDQIPTAPGDPEEYFYDRLVGGRKRLEMDGRRICRWVRVTNRTQDTTWYGLNYRGQALVTAVLEPEGMDSDYIFSENFFNADGSLVHKRSPQRGGPQSVLNYSVYHYDEIDPGANNGDAGRRFAFWARRRNLIEERHVSVPGVYDFDIQPTSFHGPADATVSKTYQRFVEYRYEPLFNQLHASVFGHILQLPPMDGSSPEPPRIYDYRILREFDYQEFSLTADLDPLTDPLGAFIYSLERWGMIEPFADLMADAPTLDVDGVQWLVPLHFYGEDLNGDGYIGFRSNNTEYPANDIKGIPVRIIAEDLSDPASRRFTYLQWAPHGQPARIQTPGLKNTYFSYYSLDDMPDGAGVKPLDWMINPGYKSFLARVDVHKFTNDSTANNLLTSGCPTKLPAAYQWLVPDCNNIEGVLDSMGLAPEMIAQIIASEPDPLERDQLQRTSFAYNVTGHISDVWHEDRHTRLIRDSDGRPIKVTDPLGNETFTNYNVFGMPERVEMLDDSQNILQQFEMRYDNENNLTWQCQALLPGACDQLLDAPPSAYDPGYISSDYRLQSFGYDDEGRLAYYADPSALITFISRNARGQIVHIYTPDPTEVMEPRATTYHWDARSRLTGIDYGTLATRTQEGPLSESFGYDGFNRLISHVDARSVQWQFAYNAADQMVRQGISSTPYSTSFPSSNGIFEQTLARNAHGEVTDVWKNGIHVSHFERGKDGLIWKAETLGKGPAYFAYDALGRQLWSQNAVGDRFVTTHSPDGLQSITAQIRQKPDASYLTTTQIVNARADGAPESIITAGHGGVIRATQQLVHDPLGQLARRVDAGGHATEYVRDLAGQVLRERIEFDPNSVDEVEYTYNSVGNVTSIIDPEGQTTLITYNPFGERRLIDTPGHGDTERELSYDGYGRLSSIDFSDSNRLLFSYDARGDLATKKVMDPLSNTLMMDEFTHDALGRLEWTRNNNPNLMQFGFVADDLKVERTYAYDLLGHRIAESLQVGTTGPTYWVERDYFLDQHPATPGVATWGEAVKYPSNSFTFKMMDAAGRLSQIFREDASGSREADFRWVGDLYAGRDQQWDPYVDPLRESATFDVFGQRIGWKYQALDLINDNPNTPADVGWADDYCNESYDPTRCGNPLLKIDLWRDFGGRIVAKDWRYGYPIASPGTGSPMPDTQHFYRWQGFDYNWQHHLSKRWDYVSQTTAFNINGFTNPQPNNGAVAGIAQSSGASEREYVPFGPIGSLYEINDHSGFGYSINFGFRLSGHRLDYVELDDIQDSVTHDRLARITHALDYDYHWDPQSRLIAAESTNYQANEYYVYDTAGRLVAILDDPYAPNDKSVFVHDGEQIIAAYDGNDDLLWEAVWGPRLDQLIEWTDHRLSGEVYVPITDERGSLLANWLADPGNPGISEFAEYDPHGRLEIFDAAEQQTCKEAGNAQTVCENPNGAPFGFVGALRSRHTGLVYMRNRWYSPRLTQFLSPDPLGYVDSFNPYAYVAFDPINGWDPWGLQNSSQAWLGRHTRDAIRDTRILIDKILPRAAECYLRQCSVLEDQDTARLENAEKRAGDVMDFLTGKNTADVAAGMLKQAGNDVIQVGCTTNLFCSIYQSATGPIAPFSLNNNAQEVGALSFSTTLLIAGSTSALKSGSGIRAGATRSITQNTPNHLAARFATTQERLTLLEKVITPSGEINTSKTVANQLAQGGVRQHIPTQAILETIGSGKRVPDPQNVPGQFMYKSSASFNGSERILEVLVHESSGQIRHVLYK